MIKKTPEQIYEYVLNYKNDLKDNYNDEQEKRFDASNKLKMQLSSQLIVFSSLLLSIGAGYLLSNHPPNVAARNLIVVAIFSFAISVGFGLIGTHLASEFHLKWAKNAHDKGGMVYKDSSRTVEELEALLKKIGKREADMEQSSSRVPFAGQAILFAVGMALVLWAMCLVAFR